MAIEMRTTQVVVKEIGMESVLMCIASARLFNK